MKFLGSFSKGPAYAMTLKEKMKVVGDASQAMEDHAGLNQHIRLHGLRRDTFQSTLIFEGHEYIGLTLY